MSVILVDCSWGSFLGFNVIDLLNLFVKVLGKNGWEDDPVPKMISVEHISRRVSTEHYQNEIFEKCKTFKAYDFCIQMLKVTHISTFLTFCWVGLTMVHSIK